MINPSYEYIAGFVDGEGYLRLAINNKKHYLTADLGITNTNKYILECIQTVIGGIIEAQKPRKQHWKPGYVLRIRGKKVLDIIDKIYPYLIIKKKQAQTIKDFYHFRSLLTKEERTSEIDIDGRIYRSLKAEIIAVELVFFNRIKQLNKKGVEVLNGEKEGIERSKEENYRNS